MKKNIALLLALMLVLASFAACGGKEEAPAPAPAPAPAEEPAAGALTDGEYFAEMPDFDQQGWKDNVTVTVADGKIASVVLDATNAEGKTKLEAVAAGEYDLKQAGAKDGWDVQTKYIADYVVTNQGTGDIAFNAEGKSDAISGATISYGHYMELINKALEGAK